MPPKIYPKYTLFDQQRNQGKANLYALVMEHDLTFKRDQDIHRQVTELLKVLLHYVGHTYPYDELAKEFLKILKMLNFPKYTHPSVDWIVNQVEYIFQVRKYQRV